MKGRRGVFVRISTCALCAAALVASFAVSSLAAGCSPDSPLPAELLADAMRSSPSNCDELTYQNFGAEFFFKYCLRCHNEMLVGDLARTDAPTGINFNTLDDIRRFQSRIRLRAGVQGDMPPHIAPVPRPSEEDRVNLIRWIDCGMPGGG